MGEIFRILVYAVAVWHSAELSMRNGRVYGFALSILFLSFIYRVFSFVAWGQSGSQTAFWGNIAAVILISAILYDRIMERKKD